VKIAQQAVDKVAGKRSGASRSANTARLSRLLRYLTGSKG
jgi:hypothetical protein